MAGARTAVSLQASFCSPAWSLTVVSPAWWFPCSKGMYVQSHFCYLLLIRNKSLTDSEIESRLIAVGEGAWG